MDAITTSHQARPRELQKPEPVKKQNARRPHKSQGNGKAINWKVKATWKMARKSDFTAKSSESFTTRLTDDRASVSSNENATGFASFETKLVTYSRTIFLVILLTIAAACAVTTYIVLSKQEENAFDAEVKTSSTLMIHFEDSANSHQFSHL